MGMQGKNAVVTGGSRGIGRAISEELAMRGVNVAIADIQEEQGNITAQEISELHGVNTTGIKVDVSDPASAKTMIDTAIKELGQVDILVNNAGVTRDNLIMRMSDEDCTFSMAGEGELGYSGR